MKKLIITLTTASLWFIGLQAQDNKHAKIIPCITTEMTEELMKQDPQYKINQDELERFTEQYELQQRNNSSANKTSSVVRIIPVVFHVIHAGGNENISDAQLLSQIDVLNADFRRLNADTTDTPGPFKPLGADCQIEFRMAQLDPNGNCTDGIVRVFSPLTYNARNNVKALSYWPSNKYLNIWIVKTIENSNGGPGNVIGFAQFPGTGTAATDGVVFASDWTGNIGTAVANGGEGRTATHEVGHWLNLRHIWGDDAGACTGSDMVSDTPNQADWTLSICPTFPLLDACTGTGNGVLFSNYMDYTNGNCQNIFTTGQSSRMNATLSLATSGRNNLHTTANLIATGTNGTVAVPCAVIPSMVYDTKYICAGGTVSFNEYYYNGVATSRVWTFPGGTPATSTNPNEIVTYNTPGTYDVIYSVSNAVGTNTITYTGFVVVSPSVASINAPYADGFEGIFPGTDYQIYDADNTYMWEQTTLAAATGTNSIYLNNFAGNQGIDAFITPNYNCTNVSNISLKYKVAYAVKSTTCTDYLKISVSTDCGKSWTFKNSKSGLTLATVSTAVTSAFVPTAAQWRQETINMSGNATNKANVRFKFEYGVASSSAATAVKGNNIYIDDINLTGTVGFNESFAEEAGMELSPNPTQNSSNLTFVTTQTADVQIKVIDVVGKVCQTQLLEKLAPGNHQYQVGNDLNKGVYFVELSSKGKKGVLKLIIQ